MKKFKSPFVLILAALAGLFLLGEIAIRGKNFIASRRSAPVVKRKLSAVKSDQYEKIRKLEEPGFPALVDGRVISLSKLYFIPYSTNSFRLRPNSEGYQVLPNGSGRLFLPASVKPEDFGFAPDRVTFYRINSRGFRDDEISDSAPFRILLLGDSITFGSYIARPHIFADVLEKMIRENVNDEADVVNFGIPAYNAEQELFLFENEGAKLDPDIVIVFVSSDDISQNVRGMLYPRPRIPNLLNKSALVRFAFSRLDRAGILRKSGWPTLRNGQIESGWRELFENLKKLRQDCERQSAEFMLAVCPDPSQLDAPETAKNYQNRLAGFAEENGILVVDLLPPLLKANARKQELFVHGALLGKKGHQIVAMEIFKAIQGFGRVNQVAR